MKEAIFIGDHWVAVSFLWITAFATAEGCPKLYQTMVIISNWLCEESLMNSAPHSEKKENMLNKSGRYENFKHYSSEPEESKNKL